MQALRRSRPISISYSDCASSMWSLHDETINIWSHLVAACLFMHAAVQFMARHTTAVSRESCAVVLYLLGATVCFSLSAIYHTFANHRNAGIWQRMDHFGIAAFIWASSSAFSTLCFARYRATQHCYMLLLTVLAVLSLCQLGVDVTHWAEISWARVSTHAVFGSLASLPALHCACNVTRPSSKAQRRLLRSFWALVALGGIGGAIYATELLEQVKSTEHSLVGTSHQAMHIFAVAGAWLFKGGLHSFHANMMTRNSRRVKQSTTQKARTAPQRR